MPPRETEEWTIDAEDGGKDWVFVFYFDQYNPKALHIEENGYAVEDAFDIFFSTKQHYRRTDKVYNFYETLRGSLGLWWDYIGPPEERRIKVISVFKRYVRR